MHYSASQNAFYPDDLRPDYERTRSWPDDAIPVSLDLFEAYALVKAPAGKRRAPGPDGLPCWVDRPAPTDDELAQQARDERDRRLQASDWTQLPDIPEAVRQGWAVVRQQLRDVPEQPSFPQLIDWPVFPAS